MATSTGKTIGLILLVLLIILIFWRITPLLLAPFGILPGTIHMISAPGEDFINIWPFDVFKHTFRSMLPLALLVLWIFVIVWVYRDAERRNMNGVLWALLVFIGNVIGLLIYLIVRSDVARVTREAQATEFCPSCRKPVDSNFVFCPDCGARMQTVCPKCKKPVESDWRICPHCGEKLTNSE
ncbi:MAG: zinc-ribbon domain-containing protein [Candidatus Aminicenantes bacterium]|nr:MAG: zinc-ribbon domain-containing protein [Candidatus Aminicenantes bacterium]